MRDDKWLYQLLDNIWDQHFSDVPQDNFVRIVWGRKTRNRLGSIKVDPKDPEVSIITLNSLFKDSEVPEFVIKATLVHELCHYAHGFNSPLEQKYRHPHAHGVMRAEFKERGLEVLYVKQRRWLRAYWHIVVEKKLPTRAHSRRIVARKTIVVPKPFWIIGK
jgi:hypothetical protein